MATQNITIDQFNPLVFQKMMAPVLGKLSVQEQMQVAHAFDLCAAYGALVGMQGLMPGADRMTFSANYARMIQELVNHMGLNV